ncbi:MAG TPA: transketolase C-terminal domain-containing protein [Patescibacteria group bacterium]|nr:transketolase C-terminal domain-containing protein [Patescibacteria group bacterium]
MTYREAIGAALFDEMAADTSVVLLGEDVATDGGVFKTNAGLVEAFGAGRVRNTPISENGFVGVALGMAVMGLRPVVEIMFSDFLPTAGDQIVNQLAKYRFMTGGQARVPVTIRSIGGATGRFGTQHSATGEGWFLGLPGLRLATAGSAAAAYAVLRAAIREDNPVIAFEHKGLLARRGLVERGAVAEVGRAAVARAGADLTIVATLMMVERSIEAATVLAGEGIDAEVIDLRWLNPLDWPTVLDSIGRTRRLLVVEEEPHAGGWGSLVISRAAREGLRLARPPRVISLPDDIPVPYSPPLEDAILPTAASIAAAARELVDR